MTLTNQHNDQSDDQANEPHSYVLPRGDRSRIEPLAGTTDVAGRDAAANMIRQRIDALYAEEPAAKEELHEIKQEQQVHGALSKHQHYLQQLQKTATSVADIQTQWHKYYGTLSEAEKHEVWREFYEEQAKHSRYAQFVQNQPQPSAQPVDPLHASMRPGNAPQRSVVSSHELTTPSATQKRVRNMQNAQKIKRIISNNVRAEGKLKVRHHVQSLIFGLGLGVAVIAIMLFGLFNELIIAPFIQPSRNVSATPIILTTDGIASTNESKVIIPKINVEIPVDFSLTSMEESAVQKGLDTGVVHYPTTSLPGQQGNAAFFGHSSNNIFNSGKYKFAFVLLSKLEPDDMFYITHQGKAYAYKVFKTQVVNPEDIWVLDPVADKPVTAALITCDPPGTTKYRLVVWGAQISPDPASATAATTTETANDGRTTTPLPGAPPSAWQRFKDWLF